MFQVKNIISEEFKNALLNWEELITVQSMFLTEALKELGLNLKFKNKEYFHPYPKVNIPENFSYNYIHFNKLSKFQLILLIETIADKNLKHILKNDLVFSDIEICLRKRDWDGSHYKTEKTINTYTQSSYLLYDDEYKEEVISNHMAIKHYVKASSNDYSYSLYSENYKKYKQTEQKNYNLFVENNYREIGNDYYESLDPNDFLFYDEELIYKNFKQWCYENKIPFTVKDYLENCKLEKWQLKLKELMYSHMSVEEIEDRTDNLKNR